MSLQRPPSLDPDSFVIVPHVAAVDEFRMTSDDGSFVATIDESFLDRLVDHMNEREASTGDLSPIVIGHTEDGQPETDAPPVVGYARNWSKDDLFGTGRKAAFFDAWINKADVETVKRFPRRSCEIYPTLYEVDPISLLGATTPARDLGLMRLSRDGSITVHPPGDMTVAEEKKEKPAPESKETGKAKTEDSKLDQVLALLTKLVEAASGGGAPAPGAPAAPGPAAPGAPAGGDSPPMTDEEYNQMLQEMMGGDQSRKGEPKEREAACAPGGTNTAVPYMDKEAHARLSRIEQENSDLRATLTRSEIKTALTEMRARDQIDVNPEDKALVDDLAAMPPDVRLRQIDRLKLSRPLLTADKFHLNAALAGAVNATSGKRMTEEDKIKLSRKAVAEKKTFEQVAADAGFTL